MKAKWYLSLCLAVMALVGCSQDEMFNEQKQGATTTLTAMMEGQGGSRTLVDNKGVFTWTTGDALSVWNGESFTTFTLTSGNTFTAEDNQTITPNKYAIYPADTGHKIEGGTLKVNLPTTYGSVNKEHNENTYLPMLAKIDANNPTNLSFKHLGGLMCFVVKNVPAGVDGFQLNMEHYQINGMHTVKTLYGEDYIERFGTTSNDSKRQVKIRFKSWNSGSKDMKFYVPLPVGEYDKGYTVSLFDDDDEDFSAMYMSTGSNVAKNTIRRGTLLLMPTFTYDGTYSVSGVANHLKKADNNEISLESGEQTLTVTGNEESIVVNPDNATDAVLDLNFTPTDENSTLTISDGSDDNATSTESKATVNVNTTGTVGSLNIEAPTLTVKLSSGTYGKVEAKTAANTLIIGNGVTVGELVLNGGNLKLEGDLTLSTQLVVDIATTIDLNGYTIKPAESDNVLNGNDALVLVRRGGDLTIIDSSTEGKGRIDTGDNASIMGAIKMTSGEDTGSEDAKLTINGGAVKGYYYGVVGNGNRHGTSIIMTGGAIEAGYCADDNTGIFHPQSGTLAISGGSITGYCSAVEMRSGTLTISGGTFESTGSPAAANANLNGNTIKGAAVAVSQHATNQELKVEISNGTFNGVYALYEEDKQDDNVSGISMSVTGGTFNGSIFTENCPTAITGGTFADPSACYYLGTNADVTVNMTEDYEGAGFKTQNGQEVTLNIAGGKTYTVKAPLVGSVGTQTLGFQFNQGSTVIINGESDSKITSSEAKMLINNYSDLTLKGITLAPSIPDTMDGQTYYVLSNNCGEVNIEEGTIITAPTSSDTSDCPTVYAFDVCKYSSYPNVTVNMKGGTVTGNVEYTGTDGDKQKLVVSGGNIKGDLVVEQNFTTAAATGISITGGTQEGEGWTTYNSKQ